MINIKKYWEARFLPTREKFILWVTQHFLPWDRWWRAVELSLIVVWCFWVSRGYLNFNPGLWLAGGEFPMVIQSHYIWTLLDECGLCVLWNGFQNGGAPAFVELHGAPLNPIVILSTLAFGVINGSKITLFISLILAGWAQWWIALSLKLGTISRLWGAFMVVVAGHLAGKLEIGGVTLVLSTAFASMVIAASLNLALSGNRKTSIGLGVLLALAFTAGQGYLQIGILLAVFPALLIFLFDEALKPKPIWKEFLIAGLIGFLLLGVFAIPTLHFWPNFSKAMDPSFDSAQAIKYIPLTWIIDDIDVYRAVNITPQPWPYLYINYVGWVPIIFSLLAIRLAPRSKMRELFFFLIALILILLAGSGHSLVMLSSFFKEFSEGIRNPPLIVGLTVPLILGLASWGFDRVSKLDWPTLNWRTSSGEKVKIKITWLVLLAPLLWSISSAYNFTQDWLQPFSPPLEVNQFINLVDLQSTQWIEPPYGQHYWLPGFLERGYKLSNVVRPWNWKNNGNPPGHLKSIRDYAGGHTLNFLGEEGNLSLIKEPVSEFATIHTSEGNQPCQAQAQGGHIDVQCASDAPGDLIVMEHYFSGWSVKIDGVKVPLKPNRWLSVSAPAGTHHFEFRYLPWDVAIGLFMTLLGTIIASWLWIKAR